MYRMVERPRRPAITPLLYAMGAVLIVERVVLAEGAAWLQSTSATVFLCCAGALLVCSLLVRQLRATLLVIGLSMVCAVALSSLCLIRCDTIACRLASTPLREWELSIQEDAQEGAAGFRCRAHAEHDGCGGADVWMIVPEPMDLGTRVQCVGRFEALGDDDWAISSRMQGICGTVRVSHVMKRTVANGLRGFVNSLRQSAIASIDPTSSDGRALLAGCVCGWRRELRASKVDTLFSSCGTAHLVAVSGGHISVLVGMLEALLVGLGIHRRLRLPILGGSSGLFVLMCGAPASAVRAWVMSLSALVASSCGRRAHGLSGVCAAGLVMALANPTLVGRLGFLLSVSSVTGLCLFCAYATYIIDTLVPHAMSMRCVPRCIRRLLTRAESGIRQSIGASMVAQVVTLPLVATVFREIALVGPMTNAVVAYPFALLMGVGIVALGCGWLPPLQRIALRVCDALAAIVLGILRMIDSVHFPSLHISQESPLPLCCVVMLVIVLLLWPRISRRVLGCALGVSALAFIATMLAWRFLGPTRICVLDIGQGDAILVQDGSHAILVDAGPDDAIVDALMRKHVFYLDAVVITHLHDDHYAGLQSLVGHVSCEQVLVGSGVSKHVKGELLAAIRQLGAGEPEEIGYGDVLRVGDFSLEVVSPLGETPGDQNADSLEMLVRYGQHGQSLTALLTGDAEKEQMDAALNRGDLCDIDFLKVGHHGSEVSLTKEQAHALDPEVSVASAGEGNSYGHPTRTCVDVLESVGSHFLCTKDVGDVEVSPGTAGPEVRTQKPSMGPLPVW